MSDSRGITQKFLSIAMFAGLMAIFTTIARAQNNNDYVIFTNPTSLSFSVPVGGASSTRSVFVNDTTPGPLPFALSVDQPWVTISTTMSTTAGGGITLQFGVNPTGLQAGTYTGHVILTASGVSNSPMAFPIRLTVTSSSASTPPSITTEPASQTVPAGRGATFRVAATGTSPMTYQWRKNGATIAGANFSSYTTPPQTMADSGAQFSVELKNSMGSANSQAAVLTVSPSSSSSSSSSSPSSTSNNYVIFTNPTSLSFSVKAGAAATTQAVFVNDTTPGPLPFALSVDQPWVTISTATSTTAGGGITLQFGVNPAGLKAGNYTGHVILTASGISNSGMAFPISLTVAGVPTSSAAVAPTITSQPASVTILSGKTASFSVAASGTGPLSYQWSMNGAAISGATSSSYTTAPETTANNNAKFTVSVSNSAGSTTSNPAVLTVGASTLLLNSSSSSLNFGSVNLSTSTNQTVTLTNAGNSAITVSNVTVSGAGFTASGVSSGLILNPGQAATLTATFTPSTAGSAKGSVSVASNATNSPDSISLSGTGLATVNHQVSLTWSPSTSTVIGYNTYSSTVSGGPYTKLTSAPVAATSYTDSSVSAGQTYYFVVTSVNASNVESAFSPEVSALVP